MKKMLLSMVLAVVAPFAWAQVSETTTTTTTTEGSGTTHGVHSGECDHTKGKQRTADVPLWQDGHLCDAERQGVGSNDRP